jgi:hypothetical protein
MELHPFSGFSGIFASTGFLKGSIVFIRFHMLTGKTMLVYASSSSMSCLVSHSLVFKFRSLLYNRKKFQPFKTILDRFVGGWRCHSTPTLGNGRLPLFSFLPFQCRRMRQVFCLLSISRQFLTCYQISSSSPQMETRGPHLRTRHP